MLKLQQHRCKLKLEHKIGEKFFSNQKVSLITYKLNLTRALRG